MQPTVQCPGGICCVCVCKSARISTIALDSTWSSAVLHKKVLHEAQSAILALGDILAVSHPSPESPQPQGSSLLWVSLARGSSGSSTFQSMSLPLSFFHHQGLKKPCVVIQYFSSSPSGMTATVPCGMQGLPFGGDQSQG